MKPHTLDSLTDYFADAWLYGLVDYETPTCAFFKVQSVDLDAFPELQGVFAVRVRPGGLDLYAGPQQYVVAVANEVCACRPQTVSH